MQDYFWKERYEHKYHCNTKLNDKDICNMHQIGNWNIYVGTKEEYQFAVNEGMKIVCALNRATGFVSHQSMVGWSGRGCNKDNPYYLFKQTDNAIYLNMIDGDNPEYVSC